MLPWDPSGKIGPKRPLPDHVSVVEPKEEAVPAHPYSEQKGAKPTEPQTPVAWWYVTINHSKTKPLQRTEGSQAHRATDTSGLMVCYYKP